MSGVHGSALIEEGAQIGSGAGIGASCTIERDAVIRDGVRLAEHVLVRAGITVGEATTVGAGCILEGTVEIGRHCTLPPYVHLNCDGAGTRIGKDVILRDHVIVYGNVSIENAVSVGHYTFIGPGASLGSHNQIA
jgi:UDP-N-acetylglucosamine acyltransferase